MEGISSSASSELEFKNSKSGICLTRLGVYLELFFENGCIFGICKKLGVFLELQKVLGVYLEFSLL